MKVKSLPLMNTNMRTIQLCIAIRMTLLVLVADLTSGLLACGKSRNFNILEQMTVLKRISASLLGLVCILFASHEVEAQVKYSNEFLAIGVGARALGMSNATLASVDDVTSGYWNPAGLLGVQADMQLGLMHAEYFAGIAKYDYGAIAKPLDEKSALGFSVIRFGVDNIPNTTELIDAEGNWDYNRITEFSAVDYAFIVSYAKRDILKEGLNMGANMKIIHRKVGDFATAWGFGLDLGAQYRHENWRFAAVARDLTTTFNAWSYTLDDNIKEVFVNTGNEIPDQSMEITLPRLLLGGARQFQFGDKFTLLSELNLDVTFDGRRNTLIATDFASIDPHLGLEVGFKNLAFFRAGVGNIQKVSDIDQNQSFTIQPNMGVGVRIKGIQLDYALTDIGDQSVAQYSNVFSLKFNLFKKTET